MNRRFFQQFLPLVVLLCLAGRPGAASAQGFLSSSGSHGQASGVRLPNWGTQDGNILALNAWDFQKINETQTWGITFGEYRYRTSATAESILAGFHLPTGALVTGMAVEACDNSTTAGAGLVFVECDAGAAVSCAIPGIINTGVAQVPGCGVYFLDLTDQNIAIDNAAHTYILSAFTGTADATTALRGVRLYYKLQVSPAPLSPTFGDVALGHPFLQFIEALAASGITAGCGGGNYCPDAPLTRGQMAVFLAKAFGLHWPN